MNFELTTEEQGFQKELRAFLEKEATEAVIAETESLQGIGPHGKSLLRKMGQRRLLAPSWPTEYGGRGLSFMTQGILSDEMRYYQCPWPIDGLVIGPTLLRFGTEKQKRKYLPGVAAGEIDIALGYTEPEAGSDVASVQLRAAAKDDGYILNGQKVFNTEVHHSRYHWLLVRTDPLAPKHKGLSMFIVDLKSPGITVRPLITSAGLRTNEVFYEDVRVPRDNLIGEQNHGWDIVMSALGSERILWSGDIRCQFEKFLKYIKENRRNEFKGDSSWVRDEIADLSIRLHIAYLLSCRAVSMLDKGQALTYEQSVNKLFATETRKQLFDVAMQVLGPYGELKNGSKWVPLKGMVPREYVDSCRWTIVAGTSEIQRSVIAIRGLGLPRK